ncbi:hypothetical protein FRC02_005541 [Tulasnella sp. 418]|nr:hypothetical protein FRC02_005541 [Tulasnella sp. 418]
MKCVWCEVIGPLDLFTFSASERSLSKCRVCMNTRSEIRSGLRSFGDGISCLYHRLHPSQGDHRTMTKLDPVRLWFVSGGRLLNGANIVAICLQLRRHPFPLHEFSSEVEDRRYHLQCFQLLFSFNPMSFRGLHIHRDQHLHPDGNLHHIRVNGLVPAVSSA